MGEYGICIYISLYPISPAPHVSPWVLRSANDAGVNISNPGRCQQCRGCHGISSHITTQFFVGIVHISHLWPGVNVGMPWSLLVSSQALQSKILYNYRHQHPGTYTVYTQRSTVWDAMEKYSRSTMAIVHLLISTLW